MIGMKVTIKNFFAPAVTLEYPRKKQAMKPNFRGMVDLIPEACVICYQCIKICPTSALFLSHKQIVVEEKKKNEITKFTYNAELCCFCGLCDEICPTDAMFMNKMYEVSAISHEEIRDIDLMAPEKYKELSNEYDLKKEIEINKLNTVGKAPKVTPPPTPVQTPVTPVATDVPPPTTTENKETPKT